MAPPSPYLRISHRFACEKENKKIKQNYQIEFLQLETYLYGWISRLSNNNTHCQRLQWNCVACRRARLISTHQHCIKSNALSSAAFWNRYWDPFWLRVCVWVRLAEHVCVWPRQLPLVESKLRRIFIIFLTEMYSLWILIARYATKRIISPPTNARTRLIRTDFVYASRLIHKNQNKSRIQ